VHTTVLERPVTPVMYNVFVPIGMQVKWVQCKDMKNSTPTNTNI